MNDNLIALVVPLALIGLWFGVWGTAILFRKSKRRDALRQSVTWVEVNGSVVSAQTVWAHVEITYEYEVAGTRFQGTYEVGLPMVPFRGIAGAQRLNETAKSIISDYPAGQTVVVKYNPITPTDSVFIEKGVQRAGTVT